MCVCVCVCVCVCAKNVVLFNPLSASIYLTDPKNKYYNCQFPAHMVYNSAHGRWNWRTRMRVCVCVCVCAHTHTYIYIYIYI